MKQKIYVRLKVLSKNISPEELTRRIGVKCDKYWRIGDLRPKTIIKEENNGWVISSDIAMESSLDEHVNKLLNRLEPVADNIREVSRQAEVEFSCVIYSEQIPSLYFENGLIDRIGALGASLDIDLYQVPN